MKIFCIWKNIHSTQLSSLAISLAFCLFSLLSQPLQADFPIDEQREMLIAIEKTCMLDNSNLQKKSLCQKLEEIRGLLSDIPNLLHIQETSGENPLEWLTSQTMEALAHRHDLQHRQRGKKIQTTASKAIIDAGNINDNDITQALLAVHLKHHVIYTKYNVPADNTEEYLTFNQFLCRNPVFADDIPPKQTRRTIASPVSGEILQTGRVNANTAIKAFAETYTLKELLPTSPVEPWLAWRYIALKITPDQSHQIRMPMEMKPLSMNSYSLSKNKSASTATVYHFSSNRDELTMIILSREYINKIKRAGTEYRNKTFRYSDTAPPLQAGELIGCAHSGEAIVILLAPQFAVKYLLSFPEESFLTAGNAIGKFTIYQ